jgi:mycothiol system anti-sigma-R factor
MSGSQAGPTGATESGCANGNCDEALRDLERYLDGELPDADLGTIRQHLSDCYPCADRAGFEEQLRALVRERCAEKAPATLVDAIRARLDQGD